MIKIKKIVSFLFVALFMSYYTGTTFFSHSHIIGEAEIFHSHIHAESHHDTKNGDHSEKDITLIAKISNFDYTDFSYNIILKPIHFPLFKEKFIEPTHFVTSVYLQNLSLRAPPLM